jgi:hypothetical protein
MTELQKNEKMPKIKKHYTKEVIFTKWQKNGNGNIYILGHNF